MKHLKIYDTYTLFNTEKGDIDIPWVSLVDNDDEEVYYSCDEHNPLCFTAMENNASVQMFIFDFEEDYGYIPKGWEEKTFYYKKNDDVEWTEWEFEDNETSKITLNEGERLYVMSDSYNSCCVYDENAGDGMYYYFNINEGKISASGDIMSLVNYKQVPPKDAFIWLFWNCESLVSAPELNAPILSERCYYSMFSGCTSLTKAPELPSETLADYCYDSMFSGCTSLTKAPELPATTLADWCYAGMFSGCTSLTKAPELPATTLADWCYSYMFNNCSVLTEATELPSETLADYCYNGMFINCTALTEAPELPATTLADYCYQSMFSGCSTLTEATELPATTLADYCYSGMFSDCSSLTEAPELPATTLANRCYSGMFINCTALTEATELPSITLVDSCYVSMFQGCSALTQAPELPATTLADWCYDSMFQGCSALTEAPELPSTTLTYKCYSYMFFGCTNLNYIKAMFTTTPSTTYTLNWVDRVSSTGTFVKNEDATWNVRGSNGIPNGWNVETEYLGLKFTAVEDNSTITIKQNGSINTKSFSCKLNDGQWENWGTLSGSDQQLPTKTLSQGDVLCVKSDNIQMSNSAGNYRQFIMTGQIEASGNTNSLINYGELRNDEFRYLFLRCSALTQAPELPATTLADWCYYSMFRGCSVLTQATELPATTLANNCYSYMFNSCTSLTQAPELPATTLTSSCYDSMFQSCTALTKAPELPATTLANNCYANMFRGCSALTEATELPATTLVYSCYSGMFFGCSALTEAPDLPATTLASSCYDSMFRGCSALTQAPDLPATTLASSCYFNMFSDCTSLTEAPELPAIELVNGCYSGMFSGCTNLNYIKAMFTTTPSSTYTQNWFYGVSSTGTFVKNGDSTWNVRGSNGIPHGWNVTHTEYLGLKFTAVENNSTITIKQNGDIGNTKSFSCKLNDGQWENWGTLSAANQQLPVKTLSQGDMLCVKSDNIQMSTSSGNYRQFIMTGQIEASGNTNSLINYGELRDFEFRYLFLRCRALTQAPELPSTTLAKSCYSGMFQSCTALTQAPELPATTLTYWCYQYMFAWCSALTEAPELPSTTLAIGCYDDMFSICTTLTEAPELPATTLANNCYSYMFNGCTNLNYIKAMFTTTPSDTYTSNWVNGVSSTGKFIKSKDATWDVTGENGIPTGWNVETVGGD